MKSKSKFDFRIVLKVYFKFVMKNKSKFILKICRKYFMKSKMKLFHETPGSLRSSHGRESSNYVIGYGFIDMSEMSLSVFI
jgi:hypothetical protein